MSKLPVPIHARQEHGLAHQDVFASPATTEIMTRMPNIGKAAGEYLRAAALSHPQAIGGHCHPIINRVVVGSYSFILTLEEGRKDHPHAQYFPHEPRHVHDPDNPNGTVDVSEFAEWYWHISIIRVHEDTGAMLPMQIREAVKLAETILAQQVWPEWFRYGVNPAEPLVIHAFIPYRGEEIEDDIR